MARAHALIRALKPTTRQQKGQSHGTDRRFHPDRDRLFRPHSDPEPRCRTDPRSSRSEEHTSELQSLMRISYAVFCLKKKNTSKHTKANVFNFHYIVTQIHTS